MANEIVFEHDTSLVTLYAVVSNAAGQRWNTAGAPAFENHVDGNWADYDIALTEQGTSRKYQGDFPAGILAAGRYLVTIYLRAGGSPAIGDTKLGSGIVIWSGTAEVGLDMTTPVPTSNTAHTLGDCLNAARAQGFGKWALTGTTLTLYANDGTTVVRTFTLDSASNPTSRT